MNLPFVLRRSIVALSFAAAITSAERGSAQVIVQGQQDELKSGSRDANAASMKIPKERLRGPGATAADVLLHVPGVQISRGGAGADLSTASIRGATSAQTPIYLAGIRLNDDITGTADLSLVPLWMIHQVEVYRGNAPFEADRLGIGGAIFFDPMLPRGSKIGAGVGAGSFGELSTWVAGSIGNDRAGAMIAARRESARNDYPYMDDGGTSFDTSDDHVRSRVNADYVSYDLWSIGRLQFKRSSMTMLANAFVRDQGVTGLSVIPAHATRLHVQRWLGAVSARLPCSAPIPGEPDDRCRVELISSAILANSRILDPKLELGLLSPWVASGGTRMSQQARLLYRVGRFDLGGSVVQEFEHLGIDRSNAEPLRAKRSLTRAGASLVANLPRSIQLNGLTVLECHTTTGPGQEGVCGTLQPLARVGARLELPWSMEILANVGRYVRVPTLGELYGTSPIVRGNSDLSVEQGYTADIGVRFKTKHFSADAFGFSRWATDLIAFRRSALGVVRPFNIGTARLLGVELTAITSFFDAVRAELTLTALDPRDTSENRHLENNILPFQARFVAAPYLEVYQEPFRWLPFDRIALGARLFYRSSRVADPAGIVVLAEQIVVDAELSMFFWKKRVALRAKLANVSDSRNYDVVGLPLPGRSIHGSTEVWWW